MSNDPRLEDFSAKVRAAFPPAYADWRRHGNGGGKDLHLQYGNSKIFAPLSESHPKPDAKPWHLSARKEGGEGEPRSWAKLPLRLDVADLEAAIDWAVDILRAGRTCEVGQGVGIHAMNTWPGGYGQGTDHQLHYLREQVLGGQDIAGHRPAWNLSPDYQRGSVWTPEQRARYLGHLMEGGQSPAIYVQRYDSEKNAPAGSEYWNLPVEVIDGQQRIRAILAWFDGEVPAELVDGLKVWSRDCDEGDISCLPHVRVVHMDMPRAERLRFYLRLNRGGTVHTDAEIDRVRQLLSDEVKKVPE